jgi:hypothetical protein
MTAPKALPERRKPIKRAAAAKAKTGPARATRKPVSPAKKGARK